MAIVTTRLPGLTAGGRFWSGERAEHLSYARALTKAFNDKRRPRRAAPEGGGPRPRAPRSPNAELRRLERALARRKTLAAQQRCRQRIAALKREHGL
jgi:hypothetical protein